MKNIMCGGINQRKLLDANEIVTTSLTPRLDKYKVQAHPNSQRRISSDFSSYGDSGIWQKDTHTNSRTYLGVKLSSKPPRPIKVDSCSSLADMVSPTLGKRALSASRNTLNSLSENSC